jgi:hypothetical protein
MLRKTKRFLAVAFALALVVMPLAAPQPAQADIVKKFNYVAFASAARTASANSANQAIGDADSLTAFLTVTAGSGTNPTLDCKFQDSPDGGTTWYDISGTTFTTVTGSTASLVVTASRKFNRNVRCVLTIGGTTPSFTCAVQYMVTVPGQA